MKKVSPAGRKHFEVHKMGRGRAPRRMPRKTRHFPRSLSPSDSDASPPGYITAEHYNYRQQRGGNLGVAATPTLPVVPVPPPPSPAPVPGYPCHKLERMPRLATQRHQISLQRLSCQSTFLVAPQLSSKLLHMHWHTVSGSQRVQSSLVPTLLRPLQHVPFQPQQLSKPQYFASPFFPTSCIRMLCLPLEP